MISFVYFDVGGVAIDDVNETDRWLEMKREIGIIAENDKEFDQFYDEYEKEVCLGKDIDTIDTSHQYLKMNFTTVRS